MEKIIFHKHHIVPKHMGGTNKPSNLLKVNVPLHAFLHKLLWGEYGKTEDFLAWKMLEGTITNKEFYRSIGKLNKGKDPWNKGLCTGPNPWSNEHLENHKKFVKRGKEHHAYGITQDTTKFRIAQPKKKRVITPDRIFESVRQCAKHYDVAPNSIRGRIKSKSDQYKDWKTE